MESYPERPPSGAVSTLSFNPHGSLRLPTDTSEITEVNPEAKASSFGSRLSFHFTTTTPLFLQVPSCSDVNQQSLGNCWFLAPICSILNLPDGPQRILQTMWEDGGYVFVRLYDSQRRRHIIKLEKSVVFSLNRSQYHAKMGSNLGTWPVFLEKALTAFDEQRNFAPESAFYGRAEGGYGSEGLSLLLGRDAIQYPIMAPTFTKTNREEQQFNNNMMMLFSGALDPTIGSEKMVLHDIFGAAHADQYWTDWKTWVSSKPENFADGLWQTLDAQQGKSRTIWKKGEYLWSSDIATHHITGVFRVEHFNAWLDLQGVTLGAHLRQAVKDYVRRSGVLAGKRGTGVYTQTQFQTFVYMWGLYQMCNPMTASTRSYVGSSGAAKQYESDRVKGLVSDHEYSVTKVYRQGGICFIQLMNPWGRVGRRLVTGTPDPRPNAALRSIRVEQTENAVFDLELDDFTKRFGFVSHTVERLRELD